MPITSTFVSQVPTAKSVSSPKKNGATTPSKAPIFFIHPISGTTNQVYHNFINYLPKDRDIYLINSPYASDPSSQIDKFEQLKNFDSNIDILTYKYINAIRSIQPEGPYCLAGYSFGGLIAFRMAALLEKSVEGNSETVSFLGLFDTAYNNISTWDNTTLINNIHSILQIIIANYPALNVTLLPLEDLLQFKDKKEIIFNAFKNLKNVSFGLNKEASRQANELAELLNISMLHFLIAADYKIGPSEKVNKINLFTASQNPRIRNQEINLCDKTNLSIEQWKKHCINMEVHRIADSDHTNIMDKPELADLVTNSLQNADIILSKPSTNKVANEIDALIADRGEEEAMRILDELIKKSSPRLRSYLEKYYGKNLTNAINVSETITQASKFTSSACLFSNEPRPLFTKHAKKEPFITTSTMNTPEDEKQDMENQRPYSPMF